MAHRRPPGQNDCGEAYACPTKRSRDVADVWEVDHDCRATARLTGDVDVAAALLDNAVHDCQSEPAALAKLFRREKRLEHSRLHLGCHAFPGVAHGQTHVAARGQIRMLTPRSSAVDLDHAGVKR